LGVWAFLDFLMLVAGGLLITLSIIWKAPNLLMNMVFKPEFLTAGLALGVLLVTTVIISIFAIIQTNHVTIGLVILNWVLMVDVFAILTVGTLIWDYTLTERADFLPIYAALTPAQRTTIQDMFSCCGYFNNTNLVEIGGSFCTSQSFVNGLDQTVLANQCVSPITDYADYALNNTFTSTYGFMAVAISFLLITLCVIRKREEDERFKKIDAKRGGRGFV